MGCGQKAWADKQEEEEERRYEKECQKRFRRLTSDMIIPVVDRVQDYLQQMLSTKSMTKQEFRELEDLIEELEDI